VLIGLLAILALLVGLPLLFWWLGRRRFWNSGHPAFEDAVYREMVARHRLDPGETARVQGAVTWGRELDDSRLRAAVVDWAARMVAEEQRRRDRWPWTRSRWFAGLMLVAAVAVLALLISRQGWNSLGVLIPVLLANLVSARMSTGARRALRLNAALGPEDAPP
jgi:hypothetical protein